MNRTLKSIFQDIDVLGIKGGYDVEQLITPNDCRILKGEIIDLKQRIDKTIEYIDNNYYDFTYTYTKNEELKSNQLETIKDILKGSDTNE